MAEPLRLSVTECLTALGISRATFYRRVHAGIYHVTKDGQRMFMTTEQLTEAANGGAKKDT